MRLIDADGIEGFASHYTEFDGKPLTDREKDLVRNVCGKIITVMPTAYDLDRVLDQLRKCRSEAWVYSDEGEGWEAYKKAIKIAEGGRIHGEHQTDSF